MSAAAGQEATTYYCKTPQTSHPDSMQENYELSTGFTQFLLLEGTQGDVRQAVMDTLDVLAQKRLLEDRRASRCIGCTQQLMGQAWGVSLHQHQIMLIPSCSSSTSAFLSNRNIAACTPDT